MSVGQPFPQTIAKRTISRFSGGMVSHPFWPLFDLRIKTRDLELRYASDDDILAQAELAKRGIHDPDTMPFTVPWTRRNSPELERGMLRHAWDTRAAWSPDDWKLIFAVVKDDEVIGSQSMSAKQFPVTRTVETGSWLGKEFQGKGFARQMRAAVLGLAFGHLGADHAISDVYEDNLGSLKVNERLGYEPGWGGVDSVEGRQRPYVRFHMDRLGWQSNIKPLTEVEVFGLEAARPMFEPNASAE